VIIELDAKPYTALGAPPGTLPKRSSTVPVQRAIVPSKPVFSSTPPEMKS
jgi:hypothetical protein